MTSGVTAPSDLHEWLLAAGVALAATLLLLIPYVLGYALAQPGTEFTGILMNPEDSNSYFAKMLQGYHGQWMYSIPFTPEDHAPAFLGGFYIGLGHLARIVNIDLVTIWHIARVLLGLILFLTTFVFIAHFVPDKATRWTAYLLSVFGSGLGWILFLLNQPHWLGAFPVDFKMPEAHLFFTALTFPHVELGTVLIMLSFMIVERAFAGIARNPADTHVWAWGILAGIVNLAVTVVYPFLIYLIGTTLGFYWVWKCVQTRRVLLRQGLLTALTILVPAPLILYYAVTLLTNPVLRAWEAQSVTASPPWPHYLVAYGLLLLLALVLLWRRPNARFALLWSWLLAVALLVYAPLNSQRRFVEGVHVPLSILAAAGLCEVVLASLGSTRWFQRVSERPGYTAEGLKRLSVISFLAFTSVSNIYVLLSISVTTAWQQPYPLFRSREEVAATRWLQVNASRQARVLGAYETGNWIAARAGNRVILGHWAETVDWETRFDEVARFYSRNTDDAWRTALLDRYHIRYVFAGPRERALGDFDPSQASYLEPVFSNRDVALYEVRR
jgi:hypothetical protein